jgi:1,2-diacylglycerol 3-beta-galactosyltransferase
MSFFLLLFQVNIFTHIKNICKHLLPQKKMKVLFLSADTGGGHRASAESLANQLLKQYPNTEYELVDVWTPTNVYPYKTLVKSYKHLSAHPQQWKALYYISNTKLYEKFTDLHSEWKCYNKIEKQIEELDPDIVISVHPTMTYLPEKAVRRIGEKKGKYIPFFTVVTDFGSGHCTWFQGNVDQLYVASERIANLARKRGKHFDETKMVKSGLPIRDDFAVQAELMGDRTSATGKEYRQLVKTKLNMDPNKKTVLVMGGGEGVGSLAQITEALREQLKSEGVDATICVVCGRNEKLKNELNDRDWETSPKSVGKKSKRMKLRKLISKMSRRRKIGQQAISPAESSVVEGNVDVIGLGFITNMAEYMVAADVLVSKAGPGTIAEAAAVGLPVMMTR